MYIYLIRHGETDWNKHMRLQGREDINLNSNGIAQARECGQAFKDIPIDIIISSPLKRARETAEIIGSYVGVEKIIIEDNLIERDYGRLSGLNPIQRGEFYKSQKNDEMESFKDLSTRVIKVLNYYKENNVYENIIMVSHGAAINAMLAVLSNHVLGTGKTRLKNACINSLKCRNKLIEIELCNLTSHEFAKVLRK